MTTFSYILNPTATGSASAGGLAVDPDSGSPLDRFLGVGIVRPLRRDARDFAIGSGAALVQAAIGQVLGTKGSTEVSEGELPWDPDWGSKLHLLRHRKGALLTELARTYVIEALAKYEPRVQVSHVATRHDPAQRALFIHITFDVIDRNVPGNQVIIGDAETEIRLEAV